MSKATSFLILGILIGVVTAGGWFAWLGSSGDQAVAGVRELKVAHGLPNNHPVHKALEVFKERVEELSGGKMKIDLFPNEQLGTETQCLEKVQTGSLDIVKTSSAPIGNFVSAYQIFSLPYIFRDEEHYWKVLSGEVGAEMLEVIGTRDDGSSSGLHGLGYFDSGSRSFYTVKPVAGAADLKGKKIRVMNDQVAMDMVQAMGGSPTPISFGELYTALKQGTVDGAENNPPSFVSSRHYEICKYYALDHHTRVPDVIVISRKVWDGLTEEQRGWLTEGLAEASAFQRVAWREETEKCLQLLRDEGVKITEPDLQPFRDAVEPMIRKYSNEVTGPLIEKIQAVR